MSSLIGSKRQNLVNTSITSPNGLTLDIKNNHLYWCDNQKSIIERIKLDGTGRKKIISDRKFVNHPFGITYFNDHIYWSDWGVRAILRVKTDGKNATILRENSHGLMGLQVYHESRQTGILFFYTVIIHFFEILHHVSA